MPKAFWNGAMLAQSNLCRIVHGKYYFPPESIHFEFLRASTTADCYDIEVDGEINHAAAWLLSARPEIDAEASRFITFGDRVSVID
jgi:uncharacterized protein (DUF427 family)